MGNFSRDTFDPEKDYVAVRLQQGVPLVDADWNEQNDVIRQDLYNGLSSVHSDGVSRYPGTTTSTFAFEIFASGTANDLRFRGGQATLGGRPLHKPWTLSDYSGQPWTDPNTATDAGVDPIPALTTPSGPRVDLAYLDVWEQEIGHAEDPDIVNPVIGVETSVRLKRQVAVRVAEGTSTLPTPASGHLFMRLCRIHREPGDDTIQQAWIEDLRIFIDRTATPRWQAYLPALHHVTSGTFQSWQLRIADSKSWAHKDTSFDAAGKLSLLLPDGAILNGVLIRGRSFGNMGNLGDFIQLSVLRERHAAIVEADELAFSPVSTIGHFSRYLSVPRNASNLHVVDNSRFCYSLDIAARGSALQVQIHGILLNYIF